MKVVFPVAVAAFAAGLIASLAWRGWWREAPTVPQPKTEASAPVPTREIPKVAGPPPADPAVDALRRNIAERRKRAGLLTTEERIARVAELKAKVDELYKAGDGIGLLRVMREMAGVVPEGYAEALQVLRLFEEQPAGTEFAFGLSLAWFREHAFGGSMVPMMNWALATPDLAPPWFRKIAAEKLATRPGWDPTKGERMLHWLRTEHDDEVAVLLGQGLASCLPGTPEARDAANRADTPAARSAAIEAYVLSLKDNARLYLSGLADSTDPATREAAKFWLDGPPIEDWVARVAPGSGAARIGLRPGDVILGFDGLKVSLDNFGEAADAVTMAKKLARLKISRGGVESTIVFSADEFDSLNSLPGITLRKRVKR